MATSDAGGGAVDHDVDRRRMPAKELTKSPELTRRFFAIPTGEMPLLIFVNPKSGGKQGEKVLTKLQGIVSPSQVFNMMEVNPDTKKPYGAKKGLMQHADVDGLCVLVCGGDGTVGWVLATMDELGLISKNIPVATMPLGTGNDLARALKFGPGYSGAPMMKILSQLSECGVVRMDRWQLDSTVVDADARKKNYDVEVSMTLPQTVWNNYFSIGSDAHTALQFHLKREKKPEAFTSRTRNKMTYGLVGAKEALATKFRNLTDEIELVCDGVDYTPFIKRHRVVSVAFLNIHSFGSGTQPWGTKQAKQGFSAPRIDDRRLEVVGFENAFAFAKGQMRIGHALRICQCREAEVRMSKPNPVQIDGEPCFLAASRIKISQRNQATMLCMRQGRYKNLPVILWRGHDLDMSPSPSGGVRMPRDDAPVCVYYVSVDASMTSQHLSKIGDVRCAPTMSLATLRGVIDATVGRHAGGDGWSFLRFELQGAGGKYTLVERCKEDGILADVFINPDAKIRPGVFISKPLHVILDGEDAAKNLHVCASEGDTEGLIAMIEGGLSPEVRDANGQTPLHLAAASNQIPIITYLVSADANINARDADGRTPAHCAAVRGCRAALKELIESGADVSLVDNNKHTVEDLASQEGARTLMASYRVSGAYGEESSA